MLEQDDYDDPEDEDWYDEDYDRDDYREPDPEDAEIARSYEEYYQHCEDKHGGHQCDCRPSRLMLALWRLRDLGGWFVGTWRRVRYSGYQPWTTRLAGVEVTVRLRAGRRCGACHGKGWAYSLSPGRKDDRPPGYNGVSLCPCGSATAALAESRRYLRETRNDLPF